MRKIRDFLKRITGISTPIGGVSWSLPTETDKDKPAVSAEGHGRRRLDLDSLQVDYLLEISHPTNQGSIMGLIDEQTGRDVAPYQEALELFQQHDLMRYSAGSYKLTPKGWKLTDQLWALKILDVLDFTKPTDQKDIAEAVGLSGGQTQLEELKRHLHALETDDFVKINRDMYGWSARILEKGLSRRKHRDVDL